MGHYTRRCILCVDFNGLKLTKETTLHDADTGQECKVESPPLIEGMKQQAQDGDSSPPPAVNRYILPAAPFIGSYMSHLSVQYNTWHGSKNMQCQQLINLLIVLDRSRAKKQSTQQPAVPRTSNCY